MKRILLSILMICLFTLKLLAQSKFGVELKGSRYISSNTGDISQKIGRHVEAYLDDIISNERNATRKSYSIGIFCRFYERHCIKIHIGKHQNSTIFDVSISQGWPGLRKEYKNVDIPIEYYQLSPSYTYRIINKKLIIPLEIGLNINKIDIESTHFVFENVKEYNYDIKIAVGLHYKLFDKMSIGLNGEYIRGLVAYISYYGINVFTPQQIGLELSIQYEL